MALILDVLLIAVVAVFVLFGIKRGFIKSFVSLLGIIISLAIAFYLSTPISNFIFSNILRNPIHDKITEAVSAQLPDSANKDDIKLEIPEELLSLAKSLGIDVEEKLNVDFSKDVDEILNNTADTIVDDIAAPIVTKLVWVICFIILFVLASIVVKLIASALNLVAKLPILKSANKLLGGVVGLFEGVLVAVVICLALSTILKFSSDGIFGITNESVNDSFIFAKISSLF